MNQKSILIIIIILAIFGLAVVGYFKAVPGAENQMKNLPKIEISSETFDFGEVEFGRVVEYSFKVKNSGNETLEIKRIATSCACTTAKIAKENIAPGEETELLVSYDTAAMGRSSHGMGEQERIIYIKSNDPINPQIEVTIHAYVK